MSRHRADVRPRYGRIAMLLSSLAVTGIAVLGGTGVLPSSSSSATADVVEAAAETAPDAAGAATQAEQQVEQQPEQQAEQQSRSSTTSRADASESAAADSAAAAEEPALPADSGTGRRVVFSEGSQRVWLAGAGDQVERTYLVSGSIYDNLEPGTYSVYSRSEHAYGIDDSGTMRYFVRFTQGERAAIGFHDIPVDDGLPVQTIDQLGTPLSHGCIRQRRADARALWEFAPLGTTVVVTP